MGNIYLIVAPSGAGKTSIVSYLNEVHGLKPLDSYTTRPMRYPYEEGHTFVTEKEFDSLKNIVAYTEFNGYKYCATTEQVENADLYVIDVNGIKEFKKLYNGEKRIITFALKCSEENLVNRMKSRNDPEDKIKQRIENDKIEFKNYLDYADEIFETDDKSISELGEEIYYSIKIDDAITLAIYGEGERHLGTQRK